MAGRDCGVGSGICPFPTFPCCGEDLSIPGEFALTGLRSDAAALLLSLSLSPLWLVLSQGCYFALAGKNRKLF
jgi:hypothetical protein